MHQPDRRPACAGCHEDVRFNPWHRTPKGIDVALDASFDWWIDVLMDVDNTELAFRGSVTKLNGHESGNLPCPARLYPAWGPLVTHAARPHHLRYGASLLSRLVAARGRAPGKT